MVRAKVEVGEGTTMTVTALVVGVTTSALVTEAVLVRIVPAMIPGFTLTGKVRVKRPPEARVKPLAKVGRVGVISVPGGVNITGPTNVTSPGSVSETRILVAVVWPILTTTTV